jgi:hypothetical protein
VNAVPAGADAGAFTTGSKVLWTVATLGFVVHIVVIDTAPAGTPATSAPVATTPIATPRRRLPARFPTMPPSPIG